VQKINIYKSHKTRETCEIILLFKYKEMHTTSEISDDMIYGLVKKAEIPSFPWMFYNHIRDRHPNIYGLEIAPGDIWCDIDIIIPNIPNKEYWGNNFPVYNINKSCQEYPYLCISGHLTMIQSVFPYFRNRAFSKKIPEYRRRYYLPDQDPMGVIKCIEYAYTRNEIALPYGVKNVTWALLVSRCAGFFQNYTMQCSILRNCVKGLLKTHPSHNDNEGEKEKIINVEEFLSTTRCDFDEIEDWNCHWRNRHFIRIIPFMNILSLHVDKIHSIEILKFLNANLEYIEETERYRIDDSAWLLELLHSCREAEYYASIINISCMLHVVAPYLWKVYDDTSENIPRPISDTVSSWNKTQIQIFSMCCNHYSARIPVGDLDSFWYRYFIFMLIWARPTKDEYDISFAMQKLEYVLKIMKMSRIFLELKDMDLDSILEIYSKNFEDCVNRTIKDILLEIIVTFPKKKFHTINVFDIL